MASTTVPHKLLLVGGSAFRSFRCLWMLEELQVPFEHSSMARPLSKESFQHHPMGKVPSLVVNDGAFSMYESSAINTFLGDTYHKSSLVPKPSGDGYERAKYNQTVAFIMSELDAQGLWIHRKHETLGKLFGKSPEAVAEARRQFDGANQALANQLSPYLLGSSFCAADILYAHCLEWAIDVGWNDKFDPKLADYLASCQSREAYQRAAARRETERLAKEKYMMEKRKSKL